LDYKGNKAHYRFLVLAFGKNLRLASCCGRELSFEFPQISNLLKMNLLLSVVFESRQSKPVEVPFRRVGSWYSNSELPIEAKRQRVIFQPEKLGSLRGYSKASGSIV